MTYKLLILDEARSDIRDAVKYYLPILPKLKKQFVADLKFIVIKIKMNPLSFGYRFTSFRTANLSNFPYQIHFKVDEANEIIIIFAVLHAYRDPEYISKRVNL